MKRLIVGIITISFIFGNFQPVWAQSADGFNINQLPAPGTMVAPSQNFVPVLLKGLVIHPNQPFNFDFIVDSGNDSTDQSNIQEQSQRMIRYFLTALTIPAGDLWVNLSPYEKDRIITNELGQTDMGRDMLAQDYVLKQLTASLIYPEKDLGKEFWSRVYRRVEAQTGNTNVPVNTFNKVWIVPNGANVFEHGHAVYVTKARLKVMLEEDYLALSHHVIPAKGRIDRHSQLLAGIHDKNNTHSISFQIIKQIILPEIEKEVNQGKNFALLRQVYYAAILAKWYRAEIQKTILAQAYLDKKKIAGIDLKDNSIKEQIYQRYLRAYKKGVFNFIKEDSDNLTGQMVPRKYFSGGEILDEAMINERKVDETSVAPIGKDFAMSLKVVPGGPDAAREGQRLSVDYSQATEFLRIKGILEDEIKGNHYDKITISKIAGLNKWRTIPAGYVESQYGQEIDRSKRIWLKTHNGKAFDWTAIAWPVNLDKNHPEDITDVVEGPAQELVRSILKIGGHPRWSNAWGPHVHGVLWDSNFTFLNPEDYFPFLDKPAEKPVRPVLSRDEYIEQTETIVRRVNDHEMFLDHAKQVFGRKLQVYKLEGSYEFFLVERYKHTDGVQRTWVIDMKWRDQFPNIPFPKQEFIDFVNNLEHEYIDRYGEKFRDKIQKKFRKAIGKIGFGKVFLGVLISRKILEEIPGTSDELTYNGDHIPYVIPEVSKEDLGYFSFGIQRFLKQYDKKKIKAGLPVVMVVELHDLEGFLKEQGMPEYRWGHWLDARPEGESGGLTLRELLKDENSSKAQLSTKVDAAMKTVIDKLNSGDISLSSGTWRGRDSDLIFYLHPYLERGTGIDIKKGNPTVIVIGFSSPDSLGDFPSKLKRLNSHIRIIATELPSEVPVAYLHLKLSQLPEELVSRNAKELILAVNDDFTINSGFIRYTDWSTDNYIFKKFGGNPESINYFEGRGSQNGNPAYVQSIKDDLEKKGTDLSKEGLKRIIEGGKDDYGSFTIERAPMQKALKEMGVEMQVGALPDLGSVPSDSPAILLFSNVLLHYPPDLRKEYWKALEKILRKNDVVIRKDNEEYGIFQMKNGVLSQVNSAMAAHIPDKGALVGNIQTGKRWHQGGIDLNQISVNRAGQGVNLQFDAAQISEITRPDFKGFRIIINSVTQIQNPLSLMGVHD